jgi:prepilin-type N-terminal cleavage/methylation domain-containing protein
MSARRGFTFLEMVVTLSVILLLSSLMIPVMARSREAARRSSCASNLRQAMTAAHLYAHDFGGRLPSDFDALDPYLKNQGVLRCPSQPGAPGVIGPPASRWTSYSLHTGLTNDDAGAIAVMQDAEPWHMDGLNIVLLDGQVRWFKAAEAPPLGMRPAMEAMQ